MDSVVDIAEKFARGDVSAKELAESTVRRMKAGAALGAFLALREEGLLADAAALDARRERGEPLGPLAGVPIALKDAICTRGAPTTAGSRMLESWTPPYDATVVSRLRDAGALVCGKTNMDEFAMGSSNENSAFGPAKNPHDVSRAPGGSSGGSAVAVAAEMAPAALGSDTGGSIRQPAALTGIVGVKPSYGRVSRFGLIAFASSLDQIGPFATDVRSAARVLGVIAGHDPRDMTSRAIDAVDFEAACGSDVRGLRLGVPEEYFADGLDPEVEARVREAIAALEARGCVVRPVHLPHTKHAVATYYVIATAEASSNLSRYDGVRFGLRVEPGGGLGPMYGATRDAGFGREVKRRILLGTYVLSAGHYDAYYAKAQRVRALIARDFDEVFRDVDALVCPTSPTPAFLLGERTRDPLAMYLSDVYTLPASLAGVPAVSVPCLPTSAGLPVGLQIVTRRDDEATALALSAAWEAHRGPLPRAPGAVT